MNIDLYILAFSAVTVLVTIWMGFRSAKKSKTASDFFVAGRSVGVGMNASAISGEYLSAASFMGIAGMVMSSGYDALWYPVCYACGYLFLLLFIAGPLRRFGAYTIPDFAEGRFDSPVFRKIAVVFVLFIGFFYTMPQMKGAGTTLAYIFPGLPYWAGVVLVGAVITLNVALGGMKGITLVQAFQYWAKMFAISVPIFVLMAVYGHYGKQVGLNGEKPVSGKVGEWVSETNSPSPTHSLTHSRAALPPKAPADDTWLNPFGPLTTKAAKNAAAAIGKAEEQRSKGAEGKRGDREVPSSPLPLSPSAIPFRAGLSPEQRMTVNLDSLSVAQALGIYAELTGRQLLPNTRSLAERADDLLGHKLSRLKVITRAPAPDHGVREHGDGAFTASEVKEMVERDLLKRGLSLRPIGKTGFEAVASSTAVAKSGQKDPAELPEIAGSVPEHSGSLPEIGNRSAGHSGSLPEIGNRSAGHSGSLPEIGNRGAGHSGSLPEIGNRGAGHSGTLPEIGNRDAEHSGTQSEARDRGAERSGTQSEARDRGAERSGTQSEARDRGAERSETQSEAWESGAASFYPPKATANAMAEALERVSRNPNPQPNAAGRLQTTSGNDLVVSKSVLLAQGGIFPMANPSVRPTQNLAAVSASLDPKTQIAAAAEKAWLAKHEKPLALLYTYSLIIAIVCGTAGLPHILVRFYTNPDGTAAKKTTMWVMILIGVFYVFPPVFGVLGRNLLPELYSGVGAKGTDKIVLELPRILNAKYPPLGSILSGITCAGAFAAFMSTFSGLLVSMTGALAHDVYGRILRPKATADERMRMFKIGAVIIGAVAILLGMQVEQLQINFMVGQAFAIAAASYFPLLFMAVWWRKLTMKGAATGMLTGGTLALAGISLTSFSDLKWVNLADFWALHPLLRILCEQPAIWAVPLAIVLMIVVSKLTAREVPADSRMKMLVLHAPEQLGLKQEYIQEHQPH